MDEWGNGMHLAEQLIGGIKQTPLKNISHLLHDEKGRREEKVGKRRTAKGRQINAIIKC
jgi:hypothetical protein